MTATDARPTRRDFWVDGHHIVAPTAATALTVAAAAYGFTPEAVRPWTQADQANLDAETSPNIHETLEDVRFGWTDFEPEPETTGDGSGDPDVYYLTIYEHGEEIATITHRASDAYPIDGDLAKAKESNAERIVAALRAFEGER